MKFKTLRYGEIHIQPDDIISFPEGLLGFPNCHKYVFIDEEDAFPFRILQSLENSKLAFVVIDPLIVRPDYHFKLTLEDIKKIKATKVDNLQIYCIVSLAKELHNATINLQGPLVINKIDRLSHQFVLFDEQYAVNEKLINDSVLKEKVTNKKAAIGG